MATSSQHARFAKIAPDPERPSQQLRIRYNPRSPECLPILTMLEQTPFGQLRGVISQALRTGAALSLGVDPLSPSPSKTTRALGGGRFVVTRRELTEPPSRDSLFTVYDPRQPWNTHLEDHVARCEWGETNRTMLQLLISGLNAMGYGQPASGITNQASAERTPDVPAVSPRQETEALPQKSKNSSITIGVDPTQAQPRTPSGATALLKAVTRRADQR